MASQDDIVDQTPASNTLAYLRRSSRKPSSRSTSSTAIPDPAPISNSVIHTLTDPLSTISAATDSQPGDTHVSASTGGQTPLMNEMMLPQETASSSAIPLSSQTTGPSQKRMSSPKSGTTVASAGQRNKDKGAQVQAEARAKGKTTAAAASKPRKNNATVATQSGTTPVKSTSRPRTPVKANETTNTTSSTTPTKRKQSPTTITPTRDEEETETDDALPSKKKRRQATIPAGPSSYHNTLSREPQTSGDTNDARGTKWSAMPTSTPQDDPDSFSTVGLLNNLKQENERDKERHASELWQQQQQHQQYQPQPQQPQQQQPSPPLWNPPSSSNHAVLNIARESIDFAMRIHQHAFDMLSPEDPSFGQVRLNLNALQRFFTNNYTSSHPNPSFAYPHQVTQPMVSSTYPSNNYQQTSSWDPIGHSQQSLPFSSSFPQHTSYAPSSAPYINPQYPNHSSYSNQPYTSQHRSSTPTPFNNPYLPSMANPPNGTNIAHSTPHRPPWRPDSSLPLGSATSPQLSFRHPPSQSNNNNNTTNSSRAYNSSNSTASTYNSSNNTPNTYNSSQSNNNTNSTYNRNMNVHSTGPSSSGIDYSLPPLTRPLPNTPFMTTTANDLASSSHSNLSHPGYNAPSFEPSPQLAPINPFEPTAPTSPGRDRSTSMLHQPYSNLPPVRDIALP